MFIKSILLLAIPVLLTVFVSCSDSPTDIGSGLLNEDFIGVTEINSLDNSIPQTSSDYKLVVPLGLSERLFLGENNNTKAYSLLNFRVFISDSALLAEFRAGSIGLVSSTVYLNNVYEIGDTNASFDFDVHRITSGWTSLGFTSDSLSFLQTEGTDRGSNIVITDTACSFQVDNSLVLEWIQDNEDSTIDNDKGILLSPVSNNRIIGFQANNIIADTNDVPHLVVVYNRSGDIDTARFYAFEDVSAVEGEVPAGDDETIYVQAGLTANSKLWFDLSQIPVNSVINYAELSLTVDTLKTVTGVGLSNAVTVYMIFDSTNVDSNLSTGFNLSRDGNLFKGNITSIISTQYNLQQNYGLLLRATNRSDGLELFALKSSTAADPAVRPYLKITYTNKK